MSQIEPYGISYVPVYIRHMNQLTLFLNKTSNDLRLKRSNPLPNHKNTLENCMNLKLV